MAEENGVQVEFSAEEGGEVQESAPMESGGDVVSDGATNTPALPEEWEFLADADPEEVRARNEKFTQEWEKVLSMEKELAPAKELYDELQRDKGLYDAVSEYYNAPGKVNELDRMRQDLDQTRTEIKLERDFGELDQYAKDNSFPEVDRDKVVEHAVKNGIADVRVAYRDMIFDSLKDLGREELADDIKKSGNANIPIKGGSSKGTPKKFTEADIGKMSSQEFEENYPQIQKDLGMAG